MEPGGLPCHQRLHPRVEFLLRDLGQLPDGFVAERRFQDPLRQYRGATGHTDLGPHQAAGLREHQEDQRDPHAVDAEGGDACPGTTIGTFVGDQVHHVALPVADRPRGQRREVR